MSDQIPQLAEFRLPISGLYALAAPSTPPEARAEFIERAQEGEPVPVAEIRRVVEKHKARKKPKLTARQRKIARNKAQRERWIEESRRRAEERKVFRGEGPPLG